MVNVEVKTWESYFFMFVDSHERNAVFMIYDCHGRNTFLFMLYDCHGRTTFFLCYMTAMAEIPFYAI
jgi:hypothetical protein